MLRRDSECSVSCPKGLLYDAHVYGIQAFFALLNLKLYAVSIADRLHEAGSVNEDVLAPAVGCDEAKSFGFIEKFYDTGAHDKWNVVKNGVKIALIPVYEGQSQKQH